MIVSLFGSDLGAADALISSAGASQQSRRLARHPLMSMVHLVSSWQLEHSQDRAPAAVEPIDACLWL